MRIICFLASLLAAQSAFGQDVGYGVGVTAGVYGSNLYWPAFNRFVTSYNSHFASTIKEPLTDLRVTNGVFFGAEAYVFSVAASYNYTWANPSVSTTNLNGAKRNFDLKWEGHEANFSLIAPFKKYRPGIVIGGLMQEMRLLASYQYPSGQISYTNEQSISGIYRSYSLLSVLAGLRFDYAPFKHFRVSLQTDYINPFRKEGGNTRLLPASDRMARETVNMNFRDGLFPFYLPEDVRYRSDDMAVHLGTPTMGGPNSQSLYDNLQGWRIGLSVHYDILQREESFFTY